MSNNIRTYAHVLIELEEHLKLSCISVIYQARKMVTYILRKEISHNVRKLIDDAIHIVYRVSHVRSLLPVPRCSPSESDLPRDRKIFLKRVN